LPKNQIEFLLIIGLCIIGPPASAWLSDVPPAHPPPHNFIGRSLCRSRIAHISRYLF